MEIVWYFPLFAISRGLWTWSFFIYEKILTRKKKENQIFLKTHQSNNIKCVLNISLNLLQVIWELIFHFVFFLIPKVFNHHHKIWRLFGSSLDPFYSTLFISMLKLVSVDKSHIMCLYAKKMRLIKKNCWVQRSKNGGSGKVKILLSIVWKMIGLFHVLFTSKILYFFGECSYITVYLIE